MARSMNYILIDYLVKGKSIEKLLMHPKCDPNAVDHSTYDRFPAVCCSIPGDGEGWALGETAQHAENIRLLHRAGGNVWATDKSDRTALHWAVEGMFPLTTQALLDCLSPDAEPSKTIDLAADNGATALTMAMDNCWEKGVQMLLDKGAMLCNIVPWFSEDSHLNCEFPMVQYSLVRLYCAVVDSEEIRIRTRARHIAQRLIDRADLNALFAREVRSGATVLHCLAQFHGAAVVAEMLIERVNKLEADYRRSSSMIPLSFPSLLECEDGKGYTPFMMACTYGNVEVVKALIKAGVSITSPVGQPKAIDVINNAVGKHPYGIAHRVKNFSESRVKKLWRTCEQLVRSVENSAPLSDPLLIDSAEEEDGTSSVTDIDVGNSQTNEGKEEMPADRPLKRTCSSSSSSSAPRIPTKKRKSARKPKRKEPPQKRQKVLKPELYREVDVECIPGRQYAKRCRPFSDSSSKIVQQLASRRHAPFPGDPDISSVHQILTLASADPNKKAPLKPHKLSDPFSRGVMRVMKPDYRPPLSVFEILDPEHHIRQVTPFSEPVYGVFAQRDIQPGIPLVEYVGMIKTRGELFLDESKEFDTFRSIELSTSHNSFAPDDTLILDASVECNEASFINDPTRILDESNSESTDLSINVEFVEILINGVAHIVLRSIAKIPRGRELLVGYGERWWGMFHKIFSQKWHKSVYSKNDRQQFKFEPQSQPISGDDEIQSSKSENSCTGQIPSLEYVSSSKSSSRGQEFNFVDRESSFQNQESDQIDQESSFENRESKQSDQESNLGNRESDQMNQESSSVDRGSDSANSNFGNPIILDSDNSSSDTESATSHVDWIERTSVQTSASSSSKDSEKSPENSNSESEVESKENREPDSNLIVDSGISTDCAVINMVKSPVCVSPLKSAEQIVLSPLQLLASTSATLSV
eukprot:795608_1